MPNLSINHGAAIVPSPTAGRNEIFVPFVAHVRVVPNLATGKRTELIRNLEKTAVRVEQDLVDAGFNIATPVAFTPQFGDYTARLTIVGFATKLRNAGTGGDDRLNTNPTTDINVIHSGTDPDEKTALVSVNRGGSLSEGQDATAVVVAEAGELRAELAAASSLFDVVDVVYLEYNGVKFGTKKIGGRSFS